MGETKENDQSASSSSSSSYTSLNNCTSTALSQSQSTLASNAKCISLKYETINFPDTKLNTVTRETMIIENRSDKERKLKIVSRVCEPFSCKKQNIELSIKPNYFMKIPVEFKPTLVGKYTDKLILILDGDDAPLSCKLVANCVS